MMKAVMGLDPMDSGEIYLNGEQVKKPALEPGAVLKEIHAAFITPAEKRRRQYIAVEDFRTKLLLRQQESEAKRIEGNSDIRNHDRR